MAIKAPVLALLALGAPFLLSAAPALAAGDNPSTDKPDATKTDSDADKDKGDKEKVVVVDHEDPLDPYEDPNKPYRFIGIRYRDAVLPKFMINWFANGGTTINVPMVGPEFITRQNHLEIAVALMYADYSMSPFLFQGKSDGPDSWDLVASKLKLGYAMVDILYEIPLEKKGEKTGRFALLIGGGVGLAGVFGTLYRSQAYPNGPNALNNPGDPSQWSACINGGGPSAYCNGRSNYFAGSGGIYTAPTAPGTTNTLANWANGGSVPVVFPWIALPQISFRYKPIKQFQVKADVGFSTTGFFFGASASYGL